MVDPVWRFRLVVLLLVIGFLISGCGSTPESTPVMETAESPSVATETPVFPDLPPSVVAHTPLAGEFVLAESVVVEMRFDQSMDHAAVEAALRITPEVEGTVSWQNDRTLHFRPKALASATRYQVTLGPEARSTLGLELGRELSFVFSTLSPLEVTQVSPEDGTAEVRGDTAILLAFNHPLVPLNCVGEEAGGLPDCSVLPLVFLPRVNGAGHWVNTSLYRFAPQPGWEAGVKYTVRLEPGVTSIAGVVLQKPVEWSFATAAPRIVDVWPGDQETDILLDDYVSVAFNTPMDPEATGRAFSILSEAGEPVPGAITWQDKGARLIFTPTQQLALAQRYTVEVNDRARSVSGALLETPQRWEFTTALYPSAAAVTPATGTRNVELYAPVRITFQGAISDSVLSYIRVTPEPEEETLYSYWDEETFFVSWEKAPRTEYCITVLPGIQDRYGNATQETLETCFTTGDLPPVFSPATPLDVITLDAGTSPDLFVFSRNVGRVSFTLGVLDEADFVRGDPYSVVTREWSESFAGEANEVAVSRVTLSRRGEPLATGYYRLRWQSADYDGWRNDLRLAVVDRHLTLKLSTEEALVWVTDLRSGEPVTSTEVRLLTEDAALLAAGTTDQDGLVRIRLSPLDSLWERVMAVTGTPGKPGFGIAMSHWDEGAAPWDFGIDVDYGPAIPYDIYLYSDRPIYRPGQTILARGILREERDVRYTLPDIGRTVEMRLRDPNWDIVATTTVELSDLGGFDAAIILPDEAQVGDWSLQATLSDVTLPYDHVWEIPVTVATYRKPEFEVVVSPENAELLDGDTLRALVEADYYFGGPVSAARVYWRITPEPLNFVSPLAGWWDWSRSGGGWWEMPVVAEGEALLDAEGRFFVELPAVLWSEDDQTDPASQRWTIETTVTDESGFPVSNRASVKVHAAQFYLGLQPRDWVLPAGQSSTIDLAAVDWYGDPVAALDVAATLVQRRWYQIPPTQPFHSPTWGYTDTVISTLSVSTDARGEAEIVVTPPQGGAYVLIAESQDAGERSVRVETFLWVSGPQGAAWRMAEGRITPVADAKTYRPGDVARILVPTPFTGPFQVLMTVERGTIIEVQRFVVNEANPMIELPIREVHAPNVFVSFVVVKGIVLSDEDDDVAAPPDVRMGWVALPVEPVAQTLGVEVLPDQVADYAPGDSATLTVRTTDAAGRAVDAEVGLAVVDKAVLALLEDRVPTILEGFYGARALGVRTGDSLLTLFNRVGDDLEALAEDAKRLAEEFTLGGIGGGGAGEALGSLDVRQEFPDTAFWEARIRTGPGGEATVSFPLPDSLTTWVADARAVTADTKVGQAESELRVTKPLVIRPVTPRFFVAGDHVTLAAVVHNNTPDDLVVNVLLDVAATPLTPEGIVGISVDANVLQELEIPAGGRVRVTWPVSVAEDGATGASLTFVATAGEYQDAARPAIAQGDAGELPIYRYVAPDVVGTTGILEGGERRVESVMAPPDAGQNTRLTVRVEPSLAAAMTDSFTYLRTFPYDCTEQIVSRFLPNVLTYRALSNLGLSDPALAAELEQLVPDALDRLYGRQLNDGGWGWWPQGPADLQVSAYVALGLLEAERAGFAVRTDVLDHTLDYLAGTLQLKLGETPKTWNVNHALALYILTLAERTWPVDVVDSMYTTRESIGVTGQAFLALALGGADESDPRVATLLGDLRDQAEISATGAHWSEIDTRYWSTDARTTAVMLKALVALSPDDPLTPQVVRWLMVARRGDRWATTQETAWSLIALSDFMVATGELGAGYEWAVLLNGQPWETGAVAPGTLRDVVSLSTGLAGGETGGYLISGRANALEIGRSAGKGTLYYTAHLALFEEVAAIKAADRGLTVQRAYCAVSASEDEDFATCAVPWPIVAGDIVEVRLTLVVPGDRYFVVLEDRYPAGMEPVDTTLLTEAQTGDEFYELRPPVSRWWWWDPFGQRELRDERAVFFAQALPAGTYEVRYQLRATIPGSYKVLPATASEMYFPEVWGRTAGEVIDIAP